MKKTILSTIIVSVISSPAFSLTADQMVDSLNSENKQVSIASKNNALIGDNAEKISAMQTELLVNNIATGLNEERTVVNKSNIEAQAKVIADIKHELHWTKQHAQANEDTHGEVQWEIDQIKAQAKLDNEAIGENLDAIENMKKVVEHNNGMGSRALAKAIISEENIENNTKAIESTTAKTESNSEQIADNKDRLNKHETIIAAHHKEIYGDMEGFSRALTATSSAAKSDADINKAAIAQNTASIKKNSNDIADLRQDFERMSKEYAGGIAGVAAMANVPHTYGNGDLSLGAGVGHFSGESAIAVSVGYRVTESITTQLGVSANTGNDVAPVIGAGVSMSL